MSWRKLLFDAACSPFKDMLLSIPDDIANAATEIRLFAEELPMLCGTGKEYVLSKTKITGYDLKKLASHFCGYSLYSRQNEIAQGYISIKGGFRAGIFGEIENGIPQNIYGLCIRIPRAKAGCAKGFYNKYFDRGIKNTIIFSPPGMGKTTFLRDIVRLISDSGSFVGLCDERNEIAGGMDVGRRTMVLPSMKKADALSVFIRSCAPKVVACDEIGTLFDTKALLDSARCGVRIIATAHGDSLLDLMGREGIKELFDAGIFELFVHLSKNPGHVEDMGCVLSQER